MYVHEVIGFEFMVTLVVHLIIERKWIAGSFKKDGKKMNKKRRNKLIMAVVLFADTVLLGISSVIISNIVFDAGVNLLRFNLTGVWTVVHSVTAYALAGLTVGHLGMHWSIIAAQFKVPYSPGRRAVVDAGMSRRRPWASWQWAPRRLSLWGSPTRWPTRSWATRHANRQSHL